MTAGRAESPSEYLSILSWVGLGGRDLNILHFNAIIQMLCSANHLHLLAANDET